METLSAIYKGERVVELFEDINLPVMEAGRFLMVKEQTELLWAVVKVESGIPVVVEAYRDRQSAEMREQSWRKDMHPENDETGVFEIQIEDATP